MRGYPYPEKSPTGNVTLLVDRDGDGRFDTSTIFVNGLSWPTSVVPFDGGVFIAVAPDILYAKDTNGDGVADIKHTVFTGFGIQNVQALLNGLLWGPDGWIYGVAGGNGGDISNIKHPDQKPVSVRNRDFRFKPDCSRFEAISGGGQFGHSFDDWGHRFTCNNSRHIRQIVLPSRYLERNPALVTQAVIDDISAEGPAAPVYRQSSAEPWRVVRTRQRKADPEMVRRLPHTELFATGFFTSATGVTIYRGHAYPPEYRGNLFIGDVGGNLVHRKVITKNGPEFLATRADQGVEFLTSSDNWFRPVNFANTPDGTLLILDMYRETIEHPFSIPEPIKKHLDLTSGTDRGRLYELIHETPFDRRRPKLSRAPTSQLVNLLANPNAWWRETAQRLLIERKDPSAIRLLAALASARPTPLARVHALWTLDVLGALAPEPILAALTDPDPAVREQAARLTEGRTHSAPALIPALLALARDQDAMVRFQTAFSLGDVQDPAALPALAEIARHDAKNPWVRDAVLSSISGRTLSFLTTLAGTKGFFTSPDGRPWLDELGILIGAENKPSDIAALIARFSKAEATDDPNTLARVLLGLGRGLQRSGGSLRQALSRTGGSTNHVFETAAAVGRSDQPVEARVDAIRLLGLGPETIAFDSLQPLLEAREPIAVQLAALQALGALPGPRGSTTVIEQWKSLSPPVRREAVAVLFSRPDRLPTLLDALEAKVVPSADLDPDRRKHLLDNPDTNIRGRALRIFGDQANSARASVITAYRDATTTKGDRERGRAVFKSLCATCHRAEGQGNDVGPNLATVSGRTAEDLLIHILDPNREIAPIYVNYTIATTDGLVVSGLIADESANAITLKRAEGVTEVVPRNRIESIASTGQSLMPEGLERGHPPKEFADLITFLRGIQAEAPPAQAR
jgi:putative membrane-bound dehydrogenase-like protein